MTEPLVYGKIKLNEDIGPIRYFVPSDFSEKRLEALSIRDGSFLKSRAGKLFAEPSVLCGQHSWLFRTKYSWSGSVHAKCEVQYMKPFFPGTHIHVTGRVADQYERRGGRYFVFEMDTRDEQGELLCTVRNTMLSNLKELLEFRKKTAASEKSGSHPAQAETKEIKPEVSIALEQKELTREKIRMFHETEEGIYGLLNCLHNDVEVAKRAGLPDIIAPGRYSLGLMNAMCGSIWGELWLQRGRYEVSFLNNLLPGVQMRASAEKTVGIGKDGDGGKRAFTLVCRDNVSGKNLLGGVASIDLG
jgi:acyl dehydratase